MDNLSEIWNKCLEYLSKTNLAEDEVLFDTIFKSLQLVEVNSGIATLITDFKWNIDSVMNAKQEIDSVLSNLLGKNINIEVLSSDDYQNKKSKVNYDFKDNLKPSLTFDNFIVGTSNKMATNAAVLVANNPGNNFNPLFIYSNPGLGKTHLLNAIGNYAKNKYPDLKILYISSKEFVDEIITAMKNNKSDEIYSRYIDIDILLIDDIQFLFGKEKSSEMFFHIFNEIINNNKQIVITSDKMPEELQGIESRLISRFQSGLSFGIDPPEFETARAILERKIDNLDNPQLIIQDEVIDFMASNYCNDIRSLEGQLKRLFFCAITEKNNVVDMNFALEIFKDDTVVKNPTGQVTSEYILKATADYYYLTVSQLLSKNRNQKLTTPREICMYLMRDLLDITFNEIGAIFTNRDHSTVMKACKRVDTKINKDKTYKKAIADIKKKLGTR